jgi:hypothetical protein
VMNSRSSSNLFWIWPARLTATATRATHCQFQISKLNTPLSGELFLQGRLALSPPVPSESPSSQVK